MCLLFEFNQCFCSFLPSLLTPLHRDRFASIWMVLALTGLQLKPTALYGCLLLLLLLPLANPT